MRDVLLTAPRGHRWALLARTPTVAPPSAITASANNEFIHAVLAAH